MGIRRGAEETYVGNIVGAFTGLVFLQEFVTSSPDRLSAQDFSSAIRCCVGAPSIIELLQSIFKHLFLLILFHEGIALAQSIELIEHTFE